MTSHPDKPNRWRPRFSVKTLVIVVTLVCCYFGTWELTKRGLPSLDQSARPTSPMPFVVAGDYFTVSGNRQLSRQGRTYYFWFFGYVLKLPYERNVSAST